MRRKFLNVKSISHNTVQFAFLYCKIRAGFGHSIRCSRFKKSCYILHSWVDNLLSMVNHPLWRDFIAIHHRVFQIDLYLENHKSVINCSGIYMLNPSMIQVVLTSLYNKKRMDTIPIGNSSLTFVIKKYSSDDESSTRSESIMPQQD